MKFDDLDAKMRVFETSHDFCVLPGIYMVARLDGRGFTRLTKEVHKFEAPFDERFRDHMTATVQHLVSADFRIVYGFTQSDEISLLFHLEADLFNRKLRKLDSILAAEASAAFSLRLGAMGCFDCRISQLPNADLVREYFRWRQEDASRNALNAHCYWTLRKEGQSQSTATDALKMLATAEKNEVLFQRGVNFNDLPAWQKRGAGVYWGTFEKDGFNPTTGQPVKASRRRLKVDFELPMKQGYDDFMDLRIQEATKPTS
jgi:tRNA(His) 5'-end guanylyltransferase